MIGKDIKSVGEILKLMLPQEVLEEREREVGILDKWPEIVGEKESYHSTPKRIRKNVLEIEVDGSGWVQEIYYKSAQIKENVNKMFGYERIRKLKVKVGTDRI